MVPHMNVGDLVFVVSADRFGELQTWTTGKETGYRKFGDYGDVLIYRPNDAPNPAVYIPFITKGVHPIIHRAMERIDEGDDIPKYYNLYRGQATPVRYVPAVIRNNSLVLEDGTVVTPQNADPEVGYIVETEMKSPHAGYITKGDNNIVSDQGGTSRPFPVPLSCPSETTGSSGKPSSRSLSLGTCPEYRPCCNRPHNTHGCLGISLEGGRRADKEEKR